MAESCIRFSEFKKELAEFERGRNLNYVSESFILKGLIKSFELLFDLSLKSWNSIVDKYIHIVYTYVSGGFDMNHAQSVISKWGNSSAIRIPANILKKANIGVNDTVFFEVSDEGNITLTKKTSPKKGTLEYLFKDYNGGSFKSELHGPTTPIGNEKW